MVLCGAIAWVVAYALPAGIIALPPSLRPMLIASLAGLGLLFNLSPKLAFGRAGTTVNPLRPAASRVLVITGLYRLSRNPMYLGFSLALLGCALLLGSASPFLVVLAFVMITDRWYIPYEERAMAARFGQDYQHYCNRVRRWL